MGGALPIVFFHCQERPLATCAADAEPTKQREDLTEPTALKSFAGRARVPAGRARPPVVADFFRASPRRKPDQGVDVAGREGPGRVLIADDDAATLAPLGDSLSLEGFVVDQCTDGEVALERAIDDCYELVVLDIDVRGLRGVQGCRLIRAASPVPIVSSCPRAIRRQTACSVLRQVRMTTSVSRSRWRS